MSYENAVQTNRGQIEFGTTVILTKELAGGFLHDARVKAAATVVVVEAPHHFQVPG